MAELRPGNARSIFGLWWRAASQSPAKVRLLFVSCGAMVAVQAFNTLGPLPSDPVVYHDGLAVLAALVALTFPLMVGDNVILRNARLRLLPFSRWMVIGLQLSIGRPLRTFLVLVVLVWSAWPAVRLLGLSYGALALVRMSILVICSVVLWDVLEQYAKRHFALAFHLAIIAANSVAIPLLVLYSFDHGAISQLIRGIPTWLRPYGGADIISTLMLLVSTGGLVAILLLLGRSIYSTSPPPRRLRSLRRKLSSRHWRFPSLQKELALLTRMHFARALSIVGLALCALSAYAGLWIILPAASVGWITLMHNHFGPDVPLSGKTRYSLTPSLLKRILVSRHAAILLSAAVPFILASLAGFLMHPSSSPIGWAGAVWLGLSIIAASTITGDRFSYLWAKPLRLREVVVGGGFIHERAWWGVWATYLAVGGTLAFTLITTRAVFPDLPDGVAVAYIAASAVLTISWWVSLTRFPRSLNA